MSCLLPSLSAPIVPQRISVIGTGYLGATHAACMAELGHDVLAVDNDPDKIAALAQGRVPFYEPELDELVRRHVASGRLRFTTDAQQAARFAATHFICVGTPQLGRSLAADTSQVFAAVRELAPGLAPGAMIVGKSTVPVGTAANLQRLLDSLTEPGTEGCVAWNPEFLREGQGVADTLRPDRLVVGVREHWHAERLRAVYAPMLSAAVPLVVTDWETAELTKVAANAFLATKVSFINAIAALSEAAGADVVDLAEAIGLDPRIGRAFMAAGIGFGGGCLPKDLRSLIAQSQENGLQGEADFFSRVDAINLSRRSHVVDLAAGACDGSVAARRIAVLGAAFKPGTDDVRDSPSLDIVERLCVRGAHVTIYDPMALPNAARACPDCLVAPTVEAALEGAELVLHLTDWDEFAALEPARLARLVSRPVLIDGRNSLDLGVWRAAGWQCLSLGRRDAPRALAPAVS